MFLINVLNLATNNNYNINHLFGKFYFENFSIIGFKVQCHDIYQGMLSLYYSKKHVTYDIQLTKNQISTNLRTYLSQLYRDSHLKRTIKRNYRKFRLIHLLNDLENNSFVTFMKNMDKIDIYHNYLTSEINEDLVKYTLKHCPEEIEKIKLLLN